MLRRLIFVAAAIAAFFVGAKCPNLGLPQFKTERALAQVGPLGVGPLPFGSSAKPIGAPTTLGQNSAAGGSSLTVTTTASVPAGNLVIAAVNLSSGTAQTVTGCTAGGNSMSNAVAVTAFSAEIDTELWYLANSPAISSSASLICNLTGSASASFKIEAIQVSGITASPLDKTASNSSSGASTVTATTAALSHANSIAIGTSFLNLTPSYSGAVGFTNSYLVQTNTVSAALDYDIVASTSAVSYSPTWGSSTIITGAVATFKGN